MKNAFKLIGANVVGMMPFTPSAHSLAKKWGADVEGLIPDAGDAPLAAQEKPAMTAADFYKAIGAERETPVIASEDIWAELSKQITTGPPIQVRRSDIPPTTIIYSTDTADFGAPNSHLAADSGMA